MLFGIAPSDGARMLLQTRAATSEVAALLQLQDEHLLPLTAQYCFIMTV
jgi:hypothetical protein